MAARAVTIGALDAFRRHVEPASTGRGVVSPQLWGARYTAHAASTTLPGRVSREAAGATAAVRAADAAARAAGVAHRRGVATTPVHGPAQTKFSEQHVRVIAIVTALKQAEILESVQLNELYQMLELLSQNSAGPQKLKQRLKALQHAILRYTFQNLPADDPVRAIEILRELIIAIDGKIALPEIETEVSPGVWERDPSIRLTQLSETTWREVLELMSALAESPHDLILPGAGDGGLVFAWMSNLEKSEKTEHVRLADISQIQLLKAAWTRSVSNIGREELTIEQNTLANTFKSLKNLEKGRHLFIVQNHVWTAVEPEQIEKFLCEVERVRQEKGVNIQILVNLYSHTDDPKFGVQTSQNTSIGAVHIGTYRHNESFEGPIYFYDSHQVVEHLRTRGFEAEIAQQGIRRRLSAETEVYSDYLIIKAVDTE